MKNIHCMLSLTALLCAAGLLGASISEQKEESKEIVKELDYGTLKIKGYAHKKVCAVAVQSWNSPPFYRSGCIVVAAKGGNAELVTKAIAAQFPQAFRHFAGNCNDALQSVIADQNKHWTSQCSAEPYAMNLTNIAVMLYVARNRSGFDVQFGRAVNQNNEEANVCPQVALESRFVSDTDSKPSVVKFLEEVQTISSACEESSAVYDGPTIIWTPKMHVWLRCLL